MSFCFNAWRSGSYLSGPLSTVLINDDRTFVFFVLPLLKQLSFTFLFPFIMFSFQNKGLPPGVVNVMFGVGPRAGEPLVQHPDVHLISFTGSTAVGKRIMGLSGQYLKKLSLEVRVHNTTTKPCAYSP